MHGLHICGWSGTGKSTLIEALISVLPGPACVVKWSHHGLGADRPGSDTDRFGRQGSPSLLATQEGLIVRGSYDPSRLYQAAALLFPSAEWLVVEGNKHSPTPKICLGGLGDASDPVKLWVGPSRPDSSQGDFLPSPLPLDPPQAERVAHYIRDHLKSLTFPIAKPGSW